MLPEELQDLLRKANVYGSGLEGILLDAALRQLIASRAGVLIIRKTLVASNKYSIMIEFSEAKK